ncbi:MAG: N-acetylmuramoyl-L-alanine amidase [Candidatus Eiseniibacteriota bacterium]
MAAGAAAGVCFRLMDWLGPLARPLIRGRPVRNQSARPAGAVVDAIILHDTGSLNVEGTFAHFDDPETEASAHLVIDRDGAVWQTVDYALKAWHAGRSWLWGRKDLNLTSIGIELVDVADDTYPEAQLAALLAVTVDLCERFPAITLNRIVGHTHVAPGRKVDPGPDFPWGPFLCAVGHHLTMRA